MGLRARDALRASGRRQRRGVSLRLDSGQAQRRTIRLYYGGADTCLALATAQLSDVLGYLHTCPVPCSRNAKNTGTRILLGVDESKL